MYEVISELPPYHDVSHSKSLAMKICLGFRPRFNIKVPRLIVRLIRRCLDANPLSRPTAKELRDILDLWCDDCYFNSQTELIKQIKEAEEVNNNLLTNNTNSITPTNLALSYKTHSETIYT